MDDVGWRNLIHKTAGKMIHIADYLGVLNNKFDDEITIDEAIKKLETIFRAMLEVRVARPETLPECPKCGESGIFDVRAVCGFKYDCSHCDNIWYITEKEYLEFTMHN